MSNDPTQNNYWNGNNNYLAYMINGDDFADSTMYVIYTGASAYTGDLPSNAFHSQVSVTRYQFWPGGADGKMNCVSTVPTLGPYRETKP